MPAVNDLAKVVLEAGLCISDTSLRERLEKLAYSQEDDSSENKSEVKSTKTQGVK